jgi:hypothetical protein
MIEIQRHLDRLRQYPDPWKQALPRAMDAYADSRAADDACLPPATGPDWELAAVGSLAGQHFLSAPAAMILAEMALLNLGRGSEEHPFVRSFMQVTVCSPSATPESRSAVIQLATRLALPREILAAALAVYCGRAIDFGWETREMEDAKIPKVLQQMFGPQGSRVRITDSFPPERFDPRDPLEVYLQGTDDAILAKALLAVRSGQGTTLTPPPFMLGTFARFRPRAMEPWIRSAAAGERGSDQDWRAILKATRCWDHEFVEATKLMSPTRRLLALLELPGLGREVPADLVREAALHPEQLAHADALVFLSTHEPDRFLPAFFEQIRSGRLFGKGQSKLELSCAFEAAARRVSDSGLEVFALLLEIAKGSGAITPPEHGSFSKVAAQALDGLAAARDCLPEGWLGSWFDEALRTLESSAPDAERRASGRQIWWEAAVERSPDLPSEKFFRLLGDSAKSFRAIAIMGLAKLDRDVVWNGILELLTRGKADERLGAAELIGIIQDPQVVPVLKRALESETSEKVRAALFQGLAIQGEKLEPSNEAEITFAELEHGFSKDAKKIKAPNPSWLNRDAMPPLSSNDGTGLSSLAIDFLFAKQSKHKTLDAAPDILPLLAHIDREKSPPFALALVEGFLNSDQAASDRWALALGGLLGDSRIIPPLLSRIPDWCENSRHKLAEYAAQAISLLPGNEPLMVLDALSNRYRSKFKNVGKACTAAFNAAAAARGITPDELGDLVVPDFGFDGEGIRRFDWDGGGASAELGADFKLSWFDPDTDKAWKSLPANAPAAVKDEVKTLGKLLREAVKGQTARLEMTLVRQRRWPVARWRELYEAHPLLRSFASSLVWGIYDASGTLLRTFRRYPNGLLADAAGALEELPEGDAMIGMVHPLELDAAALDAWRSHLARFKVKQPFPQIDRPVELMDPLHGNRREIALTKGGKVSAGTFRSRSEKRGWTRGSVIDAGGISSYYKLYPGAGVEVVLPTDNFYIGIDPMESVELGAAYFAKAGSVERGSYTYDEPAPNDPRVLRFDQVPAVVWSETMSDLKAILGHEEK